MSTDPPLIVDALGFLSNLLSSLLYKETIQTKDMILWNHPLEGMR